MPSKSQEICNGSRPQNGLLRSVGAKDFKSLRPHLDQVEVHSGQTLYHPGDAVESVYFPCGQTVVSLGVAVDDDREIDAVLIGREGAAGGFVSRDRQPSYWRAAVKVGGPMVRLSSRRLEETERQSHPLRQLFARYTDCLLAQICQSTACNAAHSIEQRAAKWIIDLIEHTGTEQVPLTHEQFAALLGVGRSYASRVLQGFKADGILDTARGTVMVRDIALLRRKSCECNMWVKKHFAEVLEKTQ
ncbi:Crp/Fnr family transcriptional regulator [Bradyrhizobium rifense]|uniref:Crp/Fnr family transcriptional regulator n=1 Tax=Bradyrhizobium rifense TaxID=515499 RepID=A0A5D3JWQ3_9BRAD|nr:Crp/Fnr family transcriptional regulator [Bradyrhizobium rifense]TYL82168.1 Crp/Fnr family transcriptional regulator [Bradyrhizobium rifense]